MGSNEVKPVTRAVGKYAEHAYLKIQVEIKVRTFSEEKLDVDHSKGRRCMPNVDIEVHVETYLNVDLNSSAQVHHTSQIKFRTFLNNTNQIFGFPWCSTS